MTQAILNSAAILLQSEYPGLTPEVLKAALDGAQGVGEPDLTIKETCQLLKRCRASINNDIKAGLLTTYRIRGAVRVRRASIERLRQGS